MYDATIKKMGEAASAKDALLKRSRTGYFVASLLAGAYVGMGIALIFSIAGPLAAAGSPLLKPVMGVSFGIALTLVVLAGAELFTGNNLIMTLGVLTRRVDGRALTGVWVWSWIGNLLGSMGLAALIWGSGALAGSGEFIAKVAGAKMGAPAIELVLRAVLCNWLVCLAIWMSMRTDNDAAKCIAIFWCLYAFIACGFEHSVANMTLLTLALFGPHGEAVTWMGFARNIYWVTLGNVIGGAVFVAVAYWATTLVAGGRKDV
jgi:nitrite transporter NirC